MKKRRHRNKQTKVHDRNKIQEMRNTQIRKEKKQTKIKSKL